jgi:hypothetical protein
MTEYKIHDTKGEDVSRAVSLLHNDCDRLHSICCFPQDMPRILVKLYQTTSKTEFNKLFELTKLEMRQALSSVFRDVFAVQHHLFQNSPILMLHLQDQLKSKCDSLHGMADAEYVHMKYSGHWTQLKGHGDSAVLITAKPLLKVVLQAGVCWNCSKEGHCLGDCKKPCDNKRIDANKQACMKLKRDSKSKKRGTQDSKEQGRHGKWAPPGPGKSDRKQINGKPYTFHPQTTCWDVVLTACDPTPPTQPPPTPQNRTDRQEVLVGQLDDAMVAVTEQIGNALWGLCDTLWQA